MNRYRGVWRGFVLVALLLVGLLNLLPGAALLAPGRLSGLNGVNQVGAAETLLLLSLVAAADTTTEIERVALADRVVVPLLVAGLVGAVKDRSPVGLTPEAP